MNVRLFYQHRPNGAGEGVNYEDVVSSEDQAARARASAHCEEGEGQTSPPDSHVGRFVETLGWRTRFVLYE